MNIKFTYQTVVAPKIIPNNIPGNPRILYPSAPKKPLIAALNFIILVLFLIIFAF